jgi:hypothetical protein
MVAKTQGCLAEARLTLGYITQPLQGWCGVEWNGEDRSLACISHTLFTYSH